MDSSCASQKKIRKVLRNRRISIPMKFVEPKKVSQHAIQRKGKRTVCNDFEITRTNTNFDDGETASSLNTIGIAPIDDASNSCTETPKIAKGCASKSKLNIRSTPAHQMGDGMNLSKTSRKTTGIQRQGRERFEKDSEDESSGSQNSFVVNENRDPEDNGDQSETSNSPESTNKEHPHYNREDHDLHIQELRDQYLLDREVQDDDLRDQELQDEDLRSNVDDIGSEDSEVPEENCIEKVMKEFGKDIGALYSKTNNIESDMKEIKKILKARPPQNCIYRSISSRYKQKTAFLLLPNFLLLKKSHVRNMETSIYDNEDYKDQLVSERFIKL